MKLEGVAFDHLASIYEELTGKIAVENLRPSWLIFSSGFKKSHLVRSVKRLMDVVAAVCGLVLASPIMLAVAAAVKLTSSGPALYSQGGRKHVARHRTNDDSASDARREGRRWAAR